MLPPECLDDLAPGARVIEVGVGARWDTLEALVRKRPDLELLATDVRQAALAGAPDGVEVVRDDVFEPALSVFQDAALVYAVRCPAELQPPLAHLARATGSVLAIRAFKDEWADIDRIVGAHRVLNDDDGGTWRIWGR